MKKESEKLIDVASTLSPAFARFARRVYEPVKWHPAAVSELKLCIASSIFCYANPLNKELKKEGQPYALVTAYAEKCDFPFALVAPALTEALLNTKAPRYWDLREIPACFPSQFFVVPPHTVAGDTPEEWITVLGIAFQKNPDIIVITAFDPNTGRSWYSGLTVEDPGTILDLHQTRPFRHAVSSDLLGIVTDETKARATLQRCISLVIQMLFIRHTRPHYASAGRSVGVVRKTGKEIWEPPVLGSGFSILRRSGTSNSLGGTPLARARAHEHWVPGHWKQVRHGKGRAFLRSRWILPYKRCVDESVTCHP